LDSTCTRARVSSCVLTEDGEPEERRIRTSRERLTAVLGARPPARVLREAATVSEWVARHPRDVLVRTRDPVIARLATAPTVGPVTATAVVAPPDDVTRFTSAHRVEAPLGLTPGEHSSGDPQRCHLGLRP
jgi:transposase